MAAIDVFGYAGGRVLVVGGATGMGGAVTQLAAQSGADVSVMDRASGGGSAALEIQVDVSGTSLLSDAGWLNASITGSFPPATPLTSFLLGRAPAFHAVEV